MSVPGALVRIKQELLIKIPHCVIDNCFLSIPRWDILNGGGGIVRDRSRISKIAPGSSLPFFGVPSDAKPEYDTHLNDLNLSVQDPIIVIGARNLGNNLRIIAYKKGKGLLQLLGEDTDKSKRDYFCLCYVGNGEMRPHKLRFANEQISHIDGRSVAKDKEEPIIWALSGQPLLWNRRTNLNNIILNTYDLRHFWRIPTGEDRFGAQGHTGDLVEELVTLLVDTGSVSAVKEKAEELHLQREENYLHSAIGVSSDGSLLIAQLHGSFESVARTLKKAGGDTCN